MNTHWLSRLAPLFTQNAYCTSTSKGVPVLLHYTVCVTVKLAENKRKDVVISQPQKVGKTVCKQTVEEWNLIRLLSAHRGLDIRSSRTHGGNSKVAGVSYAGLRYKNFCLHYKRPLSLWYRLSSHFGMYITSKTQHYIITYYLQAKDFQQIIMLLSRLASLLPLAFALAVYVAPINKHSHILKTRFSLFRTSTDWNHSFSRKGGQ